VKKISVEKTRNSKSPVRSALSSERPSMLSNRIGRAQITKIAKEKAAERYIDMGGPKSSTF